MSGFVMVSFAVEIFEDRDEVSIFEGDESVTTDLSPVLKVIAEFV